MATVTARPQKTLLGNFFLFWMSVFLWLAVMFIPPATAPRWAWIGVVIFIYGSVYFGGRGGAELLRNFRLRQSWQSAQTTRSEKDDRFARFEEMKTAGIYEPTGRLLGLDLDGNLLFEPTALKPAFQLFQGAQGTWKTSSQSLASSILTPLTTGKSLFLADLKSEMTPMVRDAFETLGIPLVVIEVGAKKRGDPNAIETPPFEAAIDAYLSGDPVLYSRTNIFIRGYSQIVVKESPGGKDNQWFINGGKDCFHAIFAGLLVMSPERASPTRIRKIASDSEVAVAHFMRFIGTATASDDTVAEDGKDIARALLGIHKETPKYLGQFLKHVSDGLACYDSTGPLENFGEYSVTRISDLRRKHMAIAVMTSLADLNDISVHNSLMSYNFFMACKVHPTGRKIHGLLEEFITLSLPDFHREQLVVRALGVSCEMYVQSDIGLEERMGKLPAATVYDQSDTIQYTMMSMDTAKRASELIGKHYIKEADASVDGDDFETVRENIREREELIFTPQELRAMPADEQIILVRSMRPIHARKIQFWNIEGLRELIAENPLEGPTPKTKPLASLNINKDGVSINWPKPRKKQNKPDIKSKSVSPLRPTSFIWAYSAVIVWFLVGREADAFLRPLIQTLYQGF